LIFYYFYFLALAPHSCEELLTAVRTHELSF
jgi:hypothetical protein